MRRWPPGRGRWWDCASSSLSRAARWGPGRGLGRRCGSWRRRQRRQLATAAGGVGPGCRGRAKLVVWVDRGHRAAASQPTGCHGRARAGSPSAAGAVCRLALVMIAARVCRQTRRWRVGGDKRGGWGLHGLARCLGLHLPCCPLSSTSLATTVYDSAGRPQARPPPSRPPAAHPTSRPLFCNAHCRCNRDHCPVCRADAFLEQLNCAMCAC